MISAQKAEAIGLVAGLTIRTIAQLCQDVAQTAPIPGLGPAATIVLTILALSEGVSVNKKEAWYLSNRCVVLLETLRDGTRGLAPGLLTKSVNSTCSTLEAIRNRYQVWVGFSKMDQLLYCKRTSDEIIACHAEISRCLEEFNIAAHLDILQFETQAEMARQQDQQHMFGKINELLVGQLEQKNQILSLGTMTQQNNLLLTDLMGMMQEALPNFDQGDHRHTEIQSKIWNVKEATGILPPITNLQGKEVRRVGQHPVGMGAQFDIWEGEFMGREKVALKILRGVNPRPNQIKRFDRESRIWRQVWEVDRGNYILPYYGTVYDDGPYPYMVSPWQPNGTLIAWVTKNPDVDRIPLIRGIAKGLELLHTWSPEPIVHGDIKGENILIDNRGRPLITDFSLSKILEDVTGTPFTQSKGISDSYRWFAPEICSAPGVLSVQSDIFSFAMTIVELITGTAPYAEVRRTTEVLFNMQKGMRPQRPTDYKMVQRGLTDGLWGLLEKCWAHDPAMRIGVQQFIAEFDALFPLRN